MHLFGKAAGRWRAFVLAELSWFGAAADPTKPGAPKTLKRGGWGGKQKPQTAATLLETLAIVSSPESSHIKPAESANIYI